MLTPPAEMAVSDKFVGAIGGVMSRPIVKVKPLLAAPPTVTTTIPVVAAAGTTTPMLVGFQLLAAPAGAPLNVTVLVPCVAPKLVPEIVTKLPTGPEGGLMLVMLGGGSVTVKATAKLAPPFTVTTTYPVVAPAGTGAIMLVSLQNVGVAATPPNVTVLVPWVAPKVVPVIVTGVPTGPEAGLKLVIIGCVTVKVTPLLATPSSVTTTGPVVAPDGTNVPTLVGLKLVTAAPTPLNETVGAPCPANRFVPVIVTGVAYIPDDGLRFVILGGGTMTVKFTELLLTRPTLTFTAAPAPNGTGTTMLV